MKRCQRCGFVIDGRAKEITPFSDSGAKPTVWLHPTDAGCNAATVAHGANATYTSRLDRYRQ